MTNSGFEEPVEKFFQLPAVEPIYKLVNGLHKMHYRHMAACSYEEAFDDTDHRMYRRKPLFCLWARSNLGAMPMMLCKNLQHCQGIGPKLGSRHQVLATLLYLLEIGSRSRYATDTLAMPHYGEHYIYARLRHRVRTDPAGNRRTLCHPSAPNLATIRTLVQPLLQHK